MREENVLLRRLAALICLPAAVAVSVLAFAQSFFDRLA